MISGLDDGDEVINLDEQSILPQAEPWAPVAQHQFAQPAQQPQAYTQQNDIEYAHAYGNDEGAYNDAMEVEEQPQRSQADVNQLLLRIKKV